MGAYVERRAFGTLTLQITFPRREVRPMWSAALMSLKSLLGVRALAMVAMVAGVGALCQRRGYAGVLA